MILYLKVRNYETEETAKCDDIVQLMWSIFLRYSKLVGHSYILPTKEYVWLMLSASLSLHLQLTGSCICFSTNCQWVVQFACEKISVKTLKEKKTKEKWEYLYLLVVRFPPLSFIPLIMTFKYVSFSGQFELASFKHFSLLAF